MKTFYYICNLETHKHKQVKQDELIKELRLHTKRNNERYDYEKEKFIKYLNHQCIFKNICLMKISMYESLSKKERYGWKEQS